MDRNRTKRMFAEELERMVAQMPFEDVRVSKLCERCDVQRALFYYHFSDKYDLIAWIFIQDLRMSMAADDSNGSIVDVMAGALGRMWNRRGFYKRVFEDRGQNSIEQYIQRFDVQLNARIVAQATGASPSPRELFLIKSSSYGSIFCSVEWLRGDIEATPLEVAQWVYEGMPDFLQQAYVKSFSKESFDLGGPEGTVPFGPRAR